jgi:hypothetical protein
LEEIDPMKNRRLATVIALIALVGTACGDAATTPTAVPTGTPAPTSAPTAAPATPATTPAPTAGSVAAPSSAAGQPQTIHVLEDPIDFSHVKVGSLTGCSATDCQGDTLIGHSRMLDATTRKVVGTFLVSCFLVDPAQSLYSCPANTITLTDRGQIVFTETLRFVTGASQELWPIIGGTGEFLGVTGTIDGPDDTTWPYADLVITYTK